MFVNKEKYVSLPSVRGDVLLSSAKKSGLTY
jgi:hypothetical protein